VLRRGSGRAGAREGEEKEVFTHLSFPAVQYKAIGYRSLSLKSSNTRRRAGPE
jgi:hypothetical protein